MIKALDFSTQSEHNNIDQQKHQCYAVLLFAGKSITDLIFDLFRTARDIRFWWTVDIMVFDYKVYWFMKSSF